MKTLLMFATAVAVLAVAPYAAAQQTTFRDSRGSTVGAASRSGNQVTFRDTRGTTTGYRPLALGQTTYRTSRGSTVGTSTSPRR